MTGPSQQGEWETRDSLIFILFHNTLQNILLSCWPWLLLTPGFGAQYVTQHVACRHYNLFQYAAFYISTQLKMQWQRIFPSELTVSGINSGWAGSKTHSKHGSKEKNHITNTPYFWEYKFSSSVTLFSVLHSQISMTWHMSFYINSQLLVSWTFLVQLLNPNVAPHSRITFVLTCIILQGHTLVSKTYWLML